jgi:hypothetical protein
MWNNSGERQNMIEVQLKKKMSGFRVHVQTHILVLQNIYLEKKLLKKVVLMSEALVLLTQSDLR